MHAARLDNSKRLQAILAVLRAHGDTGATTRQLAEATGSQAVHSDVAELRANGITVACELEAVVNGRRIYRYTLRENAPVVPWCGVRDDEDDEGLSRGECIRRMREAVRG